VVESKNSIGQWKLAVKTSICSSVTVHICRNTLVYIALLVRSDLRIVHTHTQTHTHTTILRLSEIFPGQLGEPVPVNKNCKAVDCPELRISCLVGLRSQALLFLCFRFGSPAGAVQQFCRGAVQVCLCHRDSVHQPLQVCNAWLHTLFAPPIRACSSTMLRVINVCMYVCVADGLPVSLMLPNNICPHLS